MGRGKKNINIKFKYGKYLNINYIGGDVLQEIFKMFFLV
jgi:hypothetical protein